MHVQVTWNLLLFAIGDYSVKTVTVYESEFILLL